MREEIEKIIAKEKEKLNTTLEKEQSNENIEQNIRKLVEEQNQKVMEEKEYKNELLQTLEKLKKLDINIPYTENMSIQELEILLNDVKF